MSSKNSRHSPSPSSPPPPTSKLPRFLQKQANRDRSKSMTDHAPSQSTSSLISSASTSSEIPATQSSSSKPRKSSKFLPLRDKDKDDKSRRSSESSGQPKDANAEMEEPPVIIEPVSIPRPRTRSERPLSSISEPPQQHLSMFSTPSTSRISDLPTRLSGWFSHTFSTSTSDLSLPSLLSQAQATSPKGRSASALLTAAKHGKGHLDKAVRYLLDSDAMPDKCTDPIWLLGVQHPGYEPPPAPAPSSQTSSRRNSGSLRSSISSSAPASTDTHPSPFSQSTNSKQQNPGANWPPVFYADFTSRIWLTYRSHFPPIRDTRLAELPIDPSDPVINSPTTVKSRPWNWVSGEKGWTSDSGWGCMLRTGQSLLANALIHLHLGRDWRKPPYPIVTADYATYVQILTWFLDTPSPEAPFSVHRMALAGKDLGKDVGQWFGPSTAAGAIKALVSNFPDAGLGVAIATDGVLFQTDVYAASNDRSRSRSPRRHTKTHWGDRPVLLLIGIRLGLDGVNPIYYETIKLLYTFPQSVGIAGGRPSSSYYFVGSQADNLFYLDPHHARPAVQLRPAPISSPLQPLDRETTPESDREVPSRPSNQLSPTRTQHYRSPTSPSSVRTGSSSFSYHAPLSPSPLQHEFSTSSSSTHSSSNNQYQRQQYASRSPPSQGLHGRWQSSSQPVSPAIDMDPSELGIPSIDGNNNGLTSLQEHYVTAYHASELKTFHCDRVRKMPLSGLDPSMLIGFLCKDEPDWLDLRKRIGELPRTMFSIQDEPPTWPSDSDDNMGLESISDPDEVGMEDEEGGLEGGEEVIEDDEDQFFDTRFRSASNSTSASTSEAGRSSEQGGGSRSRSNSKGEDMDTEEDPVDPITPGPNSRFSISNHPPNADMNVSGEVLVKDNDAMEFEMEGEDDIEDDWVDPSIPTPTPSGPKPSLPSAPYPPSPEPVVLPSSSSSSPKQPSKSKGATKKSRKGKKGSEIPVPVPLVKIPAPSASTMTMAQHFPFPVSEPRSPLDDEYDEPSLVSTPMSTGEDRNGTSSSDNYASGKQPRMHTARARDGGRTQSGGVKGILTE